MKIMIDKPKNKGTEFQVVINGKNATLQVYKEGEVIDSIFMYNEELKELHKIIEDEILEFSDEFKQSVEKSANQISNGKYSKKTFDDEKVNKSMDNVFYKKYCPDCEKELKKRKPSYTEPELYNYECPSCGGCFKVERVYHVRRKKD